VVEVFPSSPAAQAGVRIGDRIKTVGDQPVDQLPLSGVADLIRGPQGSEIAVQLERTAAGGPITIRAARRSITTAEADGQALEPGVGYIKIRSFGETVAERVGRLLLEQRQAGAQGWVIDLRGNPGGNLTAVSRVAGYFMNNRQIGISVDRSGQRDALMAEQRPFAVRAPLVVLIDGDSGSGSEILAAAFKEHQLATLVGQKTAGSVGIANTRQLSDGSTIQITVRRLLSASGAQLDRLGVEPDESATLTAQDLEAGRDPQRDRAIQLVRQRIAGG
jgi:carboxyl-terminal processing protease